MSSNSRVRPLLLAVLILALSLYLGACDDALLDVEFENDPVGNFDALWNEFDRYYALFGVRGVDWDSLYAVYRPRVNVNSTDAELHDTMTGLLSHLRDQHVALYASGFSVFVSGADEDRLLFSDSDPDSVSEDFGALIETALFTYLDSTYTSARDIGFPSGFGSHGIVSPTFTGQRVGYLLLGTFSIPDDPTPYYDAVVDAFRDCDGVIVDLRINGGGFSGYAEALVGRFADVERPYAQYRNRNGPRRTDLTEPTMITMEPAEKSLKGKSFTVLTSGFTASSSENFTLGARTLPLATVIGDTTTGVLGFVARKILPNGWEFTLSPSLFTTIDGTSFEGIGIPPDIRVPASRADVDAGIDAVIDAAIAVIEASPTP